MRRLCACESWVFKNEQQDARLTSEAADGEILFWTYRRLPMNATDFRRIALSLEGVEEYDHAGLPAFRVGGRKFASLASQAQGYGNLMLTLEQQAAFVE